jgi:hypothetical protein
MQRAEKNKLEPVSGKSELPFSMDCLGKAAAAEQLVAVHKSVVAVGQKVVVAGRKLVVAGQKLAVAGRKPVVRERKPAGRKLAVARNSAVERNLAADHKSIVVERTTVAVQLCLADTTLQAIKKGNKKKIHSFSAHETNVIQTNNANLSFLLHARHSLLHVKHETSRSKVPFFVHFSFSKFFFC